MDTLAKARWRVQLGQTFSYRAEVPLARDQVRDVLFEVGARLSLCDQQARICVVSGAAKAPASIRDISLTRR